MNIAKWLRWMAVNEEKDSSDSDWKCTYYHGYNYIVVMVNLNDKLNLGIFLISKILSILYVVRFFIFYLSSKNSNVIGAFYPSGQLSEGQSLTSWRNLVRKAPKRATVLSAHTLPVSVHPNALLKSSSWTQCSLVRTTRFLQSSYSVLLLVVCFSILLNHSIKMQLCLSKPVDHKRKYFEECW